MAKPILALGRLSFDEDRGKAIYQYGLADTERTVIDYLDFIARVTAHIPDKGQVMIRYYGLYSNARRGMERRWRAAAPAPSVLAPLPGQPHPGGGNSSGRFMRLISLSFPNKSISIGCEHIEIRSCSST